MDQNHRYYGLPAPLSSLAMYIHPSLSPLPHYSVSTSNNNDKRTMGLEQIRPKIGRRVSWLWKLPVGNQNQRKKIGDSAKMLQGFTASTELQGEKKFITIVCTTASCIM
ncbi:hypothetical protein BDV34DRAFT_217196 [Aspergillus parasiticus]|uniref:Uncharacterized protein n=1 Tax=Aspergillus parasiticus TaxID=5067 RepID=A0A5N6D5Y6_ASPPA|nr:hypothetical protein BDV34DRAFT_217196 [Aspergillus parasiticus]